MKIIIAGPVEPKSGLSIHTLELFRFCRALGYNVMLISVPHDSNIKMLFWIGAAIKSRFFSPDILISTATGTGFALLPYLLSKNSFKIIQNVSDYYPYNNSRMRWIFSGYSAVAAQTKILKEQLLTRLQVDKPTSILPCFHQIQTGENYSSDQPDSSQGLRLSYFGRLASNKGLQLLFESWPLEESFSFVQLDVWGVGPLFPQLESLLTSNKKLSERISLKGVYPAGKDYLTLLSSYHGFIFPSQTNEGLPLVLIEASCAGLPILTTDIGGIADFADDNPDCIMIGAGKRNLSEGIKHFVQKISDQRFDRARQRLFFSSHYSRNTIESAWIQMLIDPCSFFGVDTSQ